MIAAGTASPEVLRDRAILVTGAGRSGQLAETVGRVLAAHGGRVVLTGRSQQLLEERVADLASEGLQATPAAADLWNEADVTRLRDTIGRVAPEGLFGLVNIAGGFAGTGPVDGTTTDAWNHMFAVNLFTAFAATRAFLPMLRRARGSIVYFSAAAALPGATMKGITAYLAAKGAVLSLMRGVAAEERAVGVRANAIAPTSIRTAANLESMGNDGKYVERETVADWVVWLLSPASGPVSGQVFRLG